MTRREMLEITKQAIEQILLDPDTDLDGTHTVEWSGKDYDFVLDFVKRKYAENKKEQKKEDIHISVYK